MTRKTDSEMNEMAERVINFCREATALERELFDMERQDQTALRYHEAVREAVKEFESAASGIRIWIG